MLLVIFAFLIVAGIICVRVEDRFCLPDWVSGVGWTGIVIGGICTFISIFMMIVFFVNLPGRIVENEQRYEALVYQAEQGMYDNLTENGKFELVNQIREWNEDLAYYKEMQRNFWVGVFIPNIFDDFEFIPIELISPN